MADKILLDADSGANIYVVIRNSLGQVYRADTTLFETYLTANLTLTKYAIALTEQGTASGMYGLTFPTAIPAGIYSVVAKYRASTNPAESDLTAGAGDVQWDGTAIVPVSTISNLAQADMYVDNGVVPWALVWMKKGSGGIGIGVELMRKRLADVTGANLTSTATVVGQEAT